VLFFVFVFVLFVCIELLVVGYLHRLLGGEDCAARVKVAITRALSRAAPRVQPGQPGQQLQHAQSVQLAQSVQPFQQLQSVQQLQQLQQLQPVQRFIPPLDFKNGNVFGEQGQQGYDSDFGRYSVSLDSDMEDYDSSLTEPIGDDEDYDGALED